MDLILYVMILQFIITLGIVLFVIKLFRYVQNMKLTKVPSPAELVPDVGLELGSFIPKDTFQTLNKESFQLYENKSNMLVFTMANCSSCNDTYDSIKTLVNMNPNISVTLFVKTDTWEEAVAIAESKQLPQSVRWVWTNDEIRGLFKVNRFPLAFYTSKDQVIINKAIVNNLQQMMTMIHHLPEIKPTSLPKPA